MAQAKATPKLRRWAIRFAARLGLARAMPLQPSESAALARRTAAAAPAPERVIFLLPLVGPDAVTDWGAVQERLAVTLRGFLAQSDPRWEAMICCQVAPDLPDDDRIRHIPFDDPHPGNDKWRKLHTLSDALAERGPAPAYVMPFDADDLLHRDGVADMLTAARPGGYLFTAGLVMDHATRTLGLARNPDLLHPLRKPLWKLCGTSIALPCLPGNPVHRGFLAAMTSHEHRMFPHLARLAGLAPTPVDSPRVLYILNHGENFGARRGRVGFKTRFVRRFALSAQEARNALAAFPEV